MSRKGLVKIVEFDKYAMIYYCYKIIVRIML